MLRQIWASDDRFKAIEFRQGLNLIVADKDQSASQTDSRNGSGKSSIIEILHFLLGARLDRYAFLARPALRAVEFSASLDWPTISASLQVKRTPERANEIWLSVDIRDPYAPNPTSVKLGLAEWQGLIERDLFGIKGEHAGVTGRALLSLYMRRVGSNAFNEAIKTSPQQSLADAGSNLAYLLGLDWRLAARYRDISTRESTRRQLVQAAKDPVWGKIVGRSGELRGQISVVQERVRELEQQVSNFRVVPEYERLQREADEIDQRIRQTRTDDFVDRRNLQELESALLDANEPEVDYLESVYSDLGITLGEAVRRRYDDVRDFHNSVVRNRRSYLETELDLLRSGLAEREGERERLGERQASILRALNQGGALDALTVLQRSLAHESAVLDALRQRFEAAQIIEASASEIKADRSQLESEIRTDLRERDQAIDEISVRFLKYATRLYGSGREAYLEVDPTATHLKIIPHIDSKDSRGIGNMVIFCFDLTVAVTAHRARRGPDFLIHDSHLFDGVDERQVARALALAREVVDEEGMQYIVTMNSDDLQKVDRQDSELASFVVPPRLTDQLEDGGLFGFRFP